jgi:ribosomal-protein-alanine N-acetyltransferase
MPIDSEEAFEAAWRASEEARQVGTDYHFGIFEGEQFIGEIELDGVRRGGLDSAFLDAWIDVEHAGQNRVEEAFVLMCKHGIEDLGLNRIECAVLTDNEAVQRALEKVGVENEGLSREFVKIDGEYKDHYRYVVTGTDWKNRRDEWMSQWVGA